MRQLCYRSHRVLLLGLLVTGPSCSTSSGTSRASHDGSHAQKAVPLVLGAAEGERRVRRTLGLAPLIIKIDQQNGGAPEFVMGTEEIPPGEAIPPHHHLDADEIVFIQRGLGRAEVGDRIASVQAGATIYIPRHTRITLQNTGSESLGIVFFFSRPGFEGYLRETSVPEGQVAAPLSASELRAIRQRHQAHVVYEKP